MDGDPALNIVIFVAKAIRLASTRLFKDNPAWGRADIVVYANEFAAALEEVAVAKTSGRPYPTE